MLSCGQVAVLRASLARLNQASASGPPSPDMDPGAFARSQPASAAAGEADAPTPQGPDPDVPVGPLERGPVGPGDNGAAADQAWVDSDAAAAH